MNHFRLVRFGPNRYSYPLGRAASRSVADQFPINTATARKNDAVAAIALGRRIDLTRESDFIIANVQLRPTACGWWRAARRHRASRS